MHSLSCIRPLLLGVGILALMGCQKAVIEADMPEPENVQAVAENSPVIARRADPWVIREQVEGKPEYFFTASVPAFDRIILRKSNSLKGLADAEEITIWQKHASGPMSLNIWAPELHRIDGVWYVYFAAGKAEEPFYIRMYVLKNSSDDPTHGTWEELGRVEGARDTFSLDATQFALNGQQYLAWAQQDDAKSYNTAILLAKLISPTEVGEPQAVLTEPLLEWERIGFKVNEGPAVLVKNGKIFLTYSASATDHNYAMGLLWADANRDIMDAANWHKSPQPVFTTQPRLQRFGPGHNSFTVDEQGRDVMVYHARPYKELQGSPLTDGNRHAYMRLLDWDENGMPVFHNTQPDRLK